MNLARPPAWSIRCVLEEAVGRWVMGYLAVGGGRVVWWTVEIFDSWCGEWLRYFTVNDGIWWKCVCKWCVLRWCCLWLLPLWTTLCLVNIVFRLQTVIYVRLVYRLGGVTVYSVVWVYVDACLFLRSQLSSCVYVYLCVCNADTCLGLYTRLHGSVFARYYFDKFFCCVRLLVVKIVLARTAFSGIRSRMSGISVRQ